MRAGIYTARAGEKKYGYLDAMVAAGDAVFLGERYDPQGRKHIAVEVPPRGKRARRNAGARRAIRIGREFFTAAIKDYADWREKWWREAIQNAVDAGANNIECIIDERADSIMVACQDNGVGMSEEVILDKFLVLGATTKIAGGTTGGFGKAKELLLLPWLSWSIRSGNVLVEGEGASYEVSHTREAVHGTQLIVHMPRDEATHEPAAKAFISKCYLPRVRFHVNGEVAKANLKQGELVKEFGDKAAVYYDKRSSSYTQMLIRANGLYMFEQYISSEVPGTIVVELLQPSIELLSANRDGFRDSELRWSMRKFADRLATDATQELKSKKGLIRKRFKGSGKFKATSTDTLTAALLESLGAMIPRGKQGRQELTMSAGQQRELEKMLLSMGGAEQPEKSFGDWGDGSTGEQPAPPINLRASAELAKAMLDGTEVQGTAHMEAIAKQLAWEPDFYLYNNIEGWRVAKKFFPERMPPFVRKLLRFWAECCRFILLALGSDYEYGVGFVFETEVGGMHVVEDGENWLLLNPFKGTRPSDRLYSLSKKEDVDDIWATAVHEVTHMADGIDYHGDTYASALTRNFGKLRRTSKQVDRIRKAISARGPSKLPRLRSIEIAEQVYRVLERTSAWLDVYEIQERTEYRPRVNADDLAAMEARGWIASRWDDEKVGLVYSETDHGFHWFLKRMQAREKKARRTA
jgi:hypothetical protein